MILERIINTLLHRKKEQHQDHPQRKEQSIWHSDAIGIPEGIYHLIYEIPNLGKTLFGTSYYFSIIEITENQTMITRLERKRKNEYDTLIESQIMFQKPISSITPYDIAKVYPKISDVIYSTSETDTFHHKPALRCMIDLD